MQRFYRPLVDARGNVVPRMNIYVLKNGVRLPTLFRDRQGLVPKPNGFLTLENGLMDFHVPNGLYDIEARTGYDALIATFPDQRFFDPDDASTGEPGSALKNDESPLSEIAERGASAQATARENISAPSQAQMSTLQAQVDAIVVGPGSRAVVDLFEVTADIKLDAEVVLSADPADPLKVGLVVFTGPEQRAGVDFFVTDRLLSWRSLSLELLLDVGDAFAVRYST